MSRPTVIKSTPVLSAERIEPSLAFWEKLGFKRETEVPEGDHLAFAIANNGTVQIMYQTVESVAGDLPKWKAAASSKTFLYVEVPSLAVIQKALAETPVYVEEHKAPYGAIEIGYLEPAGHLIVFAQFDRK